MISENLPNTKIGIEIVTPELIDLFKDLTRMPNDIIAREAYRLAKIKPKQINFAEVHDCFSITELLIYEDFGFSPRGRAKEDIDAGFFNRDGGLPVNVDGGLKCFGHPIGASGLRMTYEVYKQLQGKAEQPERQIKNPRLGLAHTFGGPPQLSAVAVFGNEQG